MSHPGVGQQLNDTLNETFLPVTSDSVSQFFSIQVTWPVPYYQFQGRSPVQFYKDMANNRER
jgi:hypothetical protein